MVDDDNIVIVPQARIFFGAKEEKKRGSKRREKIQREREQNAFLRGGGCPFTFGKPIIGQIF